MKVTYSWLKEYVPLAAPAVLAKQLTLAGLEVESATPVAPPFSGVVVGEILAVERHPNADRLTVCTVNAGRETLKVVCGAPNVRSTCSWVTLERPMWRIFPCSRSPAGVSIEAS